MAFTASGLRRISHGSRNVFTYHSADTLATAAASGYFNTATNDVNQYDVIICVDTTTPAHNTYIVTSADGAATVTTLASA